MTKTLQERKAEAVKARYEALEKAYDEAEEAMDAIIKEEGGK